MGVTCYIKQSNATHSLINRNVNASENRLSSGYEKVMKEPAAQADSLLLDTAR